MKPKNKILFALILVISLISLASANCGGNNHWDYYKNISSLGTKDIQYINVSYEANMQTDFDDIRFFDSTGSKHLRYAQLRVNNSFYATYKVNTSGASAVQMCYGNSTLTDSNSSYKSIHGSDVTAHWDFDDAPSCNMTDVSGHNVYGTLGGDCLGGDVPTYSTEGIGLSVVFDGVDDYIQVNVNDVGDDLAVLVRFKNNEVLYPNSTEAIGDFGIGQVNGDIAFGSVSGLLLNELITIFADAGGSAYSRAWNGTNINITSGQHTLRTIYNYSFGHYMIYLDDVRRDNTESSESNKYNLSGGEFIGLGATNGQFLNGSISEIIIYNETINDSIEYLFENTEESAYSVSTEQSITQVTTELYYPSNGTIATNNSYIFSVNSTPSGTTLTLVSLNIWYINGTKFYSNTTALSGSSEVQTNFTVPLKDGNFTWNAITGGTGATNHSDATNRTIRVDVNPLINLITPTSSPASITNIVLNFTANDLQGIFYCQYNVTFGASIEIVNTNVTHFSNDYYNVTFNVSSLDTTYNLNLVCYSKYQKVSNFTTQSFIISRPSPGGGGGGGGGTTIIVGGGNWTMETETGNTKYELIMVKDTSKTKGLDFQNFGSTALDMELTCEGEFCQYVDFSDSKFTLPKSQKVKTRIDFTMTIPKDIERKTYIFDIIATDNNGANDVVTVQVDVRNFSIQKLASKTNLLGLNIGMFWIFLFSLVFVYFIFAKAVLKDKKGGVGYSFLISFVASLFVVALV